ncbi:hypothetical protein HNP73_000262 [Amaricoccus macauensis]|uniref:Uncharacterized protein n=1 Tax=Amaricoccus macauensis TaxID=57001 RepID=A0A840SLV1_9RHOB|nr:hypothetical protein [Amaricoccus macauensis]MBB5220341.1 hypothetical protein [Amaricoccus macauensis]
MALISDLVTELNVMSGLAETSIVGVARRLREDGLLSQKGRGRGAAHATPLDAARLCIALMVGGKSKDASTVVRDFGQLQLSRRSVEPEHVYGSLSLEMAGVAPEHVFEEGLAGLIAVWGEDRLVARMEALVGPRGIWPGMLAMLSDSSMSGAICFGATTYTYHHSALLRANQAKHPEEGVALTEQYLAASRRYRGGIRSTREISAVELLPLGQVVAGLRDPGWRESNEAAHRRLIEAGKEEEL